MKRNVLNAWVLLSAATPLFAQAWTQLTPAGALPAARAGASAVFDPVARQMVVFGGESFFANYGDVYLLNVAGNGQWSPLNPSGAPPAARVGHTAVYDATTSRMIVFGGSPGGNSPCANDTWVLTGASGTGGAPAWSRLSPSGDLPSGRAFHTAAYDPASNRMIVFGGVNCVTRRPQFNNDVWVLSNANGLGGTPAWNELSTSGKSPTARQGAVAVYDAGSNRLVVFGGKGTGSELNDVWMLTNANGFGGTPTWTQVSPSGTAPAGRVFASGTYDAAFNRMVLFGGASGNTLHSDAWLLGSANGLNGSPAWTQLNASGISAREGQAAVYDAAGGRMIVFGGDGAFGAPLNDTWTLTLAPSVPASPAVGSISPSAATATGPPFTLTVNGSNFVAGALVLWNGSALAATFISPAQLVVAVPAALISTPGSASLTVMNPGGAVSNAVKFTINPAVPSITQLSPSTAAAGGPAFTLTVDGAGFLPGTVLEWNGTALVTTLVSATELTGVVPANLIATQGTASVIAVNPGGGASSVATFPIGAGALTIITPTTLPSGTVGVPYSQALAATGGVSPYKGWSVSAGRLPSGISLSTLGGVLTGLLGGVPAEAGTFTFTVKLTDGANATATATFTLVINVGPPTMSANGVVNAASYAAGPVAPGEIVTIFGTGLGPDKLASLQLDSRGFVATTLGGVQVLFDGIAAPLIYAQDNQVSAIVPYAVSGRPTTQVAVSYQGRTSNPVPLAIAPVAPGIFTLDSSGSGQGAIVNQNGTVNSSRNPAAVGSYVFIYATGEGQTSPGGVDGEADGSPAPHPLAPVTATVGGISAPVQYAGGVPGLVAGVLQVNLQIPRGVATGNSVPLVLNIGGTATQANVTLAVH